ncbi:hypothetical protein NYO91_07625 [Arhodomonas aquaeolei]|uniref:hypothetical protein n=1 Tax=Arhodomonas aquaeolei TaxID=2369 RepID=UPI0021690CE1|nr:hypothetical protein [Arhodomonas aquaeolei]MCS4503940.1 hypothetical protein [Arhodomonas aquaeolei]
MAVVTNQSWDHLECPACAAWQVVPRGAAVSLECRCGRPDPAVHLRRPATGYEVMLASQRRSLLTVHEPVPAGEGLREAA